MGTTNVTNPLVQPSQNDLGGGVAGDGDTALEKYVVQLLLAANNQSYVLSGGVLAASAANLISIVPAGIARISGYYVSWPQTNVTLPVSSTSHLFVALTFASGIVTGVQIIDNISGTPPADSIKLGTQTTSGTAITSAVDQRLLSRNAILPRVSRLTSGTDNWRCPEGVTEGLVHLKGGGGGGGGGGAGTTTGGSDNGEGGDGGTAGLPGEEVWAVVSLTPGTSYARTVGAGGTGGGGGSTGDPGNNGSNGTDGGNSTFGALATAFGGRRGIGGKGGASRSSIYSFPAAPGLGTTHGRGAGGPGLGGGGGDGGVAGAGSAGVAGGNGIDGYVEIYY